MHNITEKTLWGKYTVSQIKQKISVSIPFQAYKDDNIQLENDLKISDEPER